MISRRGDKDSMSHSQVIRQHVIVKREGRCGPTLANRILGVSKVNLLSFSRYLVIAVAVVLLSPYAGCHLLTSPPHRVDEDTVASVSENNSKRSVEPADSVASADYVESSGPDVATRDEDPAEQVESNPKLSEIESLLRER
jgi:hypothetical protein